MKTIYRLLFQFLLLLHVAGVSKTVRSSGTFLCPDCNGDNNEAAEELNSNVDFPKDISVQHQLNERKIANDYGLFYEWDNVKLFVAAERQRYRYNGEYVDVYYPLYLYSLPDLQRPILWIDNIPISESYDVHHAMGYSFDLYGCYYKTCEDRHNINVDFEVIGDTLKISIQRDYLKLYLIKDTSGKRVTITRKECSEKRMKELTMLAFLGADSIYGGEIKNCKREGNWLFYKNGKNIGFRSYKNGLPDGNFFMINEGQEDGMTLHPFVLLGEYKNGKRTGVWRFNYGKQKFDYGGALSLEK